MLLEEEYTGRFNRPESNSSRKLCSNSKCANIPGNKSVVLVSGTLWALLQLNTNKFI